MSIGPLRSTTTLPSFSGARDSGSSAVGLRYPLAVEHLVHGPNLVCHATRNNVAVSLSKKIVSMAAHAVDNLDVYGSLRVMSQWCFGQVNAWATSCCGWQLFALWQSYSVTDKDYYQ